MPLAAQSSSRRIPFRNQIQVFACRMSRSLTINANINPVVPHLRQAQGVTTAVILLQLFCNLQKTNEISA